MYKTKMGYTPEEVSRPGKADRLHPSRPASTVTPAPDEEYQFQVIITIESPPAHDTDRPGKPRILRAEVQGSVIN